MNPPSHSPRPWRSTLSLLLFGLTILSVLIAMDRPEWFHIRPAGATALAMAHTPSTVR